VRDRETDQRRKHELEPSHPTLILEQDENLDTPKPVSFTVKETVCPRTTQQPPEQCDFKENGLVKECVGTVTLAQIKDNFDITCTVPQSVGGVRSLGRKILRGWKTYGPIIVPIIRLIG
uniref:Uncharacterized protein n=1 Tax=Monodon monoceros TaxID=40151 RepID=A0A8C6BIH0_MONMO